MPSVRMNADIPIIRTSSGNPGIWEEGGCQRNQGFARLVGGRHGGRLRPVFIRYEAQVSCGDHALFLAFPGMIVVEARWCLFDQNHLPSVEVFRVRSIRHIHAESSLIGYHDGMRWRISTPPGTLWTGGIINAARRKAKMENCRVPLWYDDGVNAVLQQRRSK